MSMTSAALSSPNGAASISTDSNPPVAGVGANVSGTYVGTLIFEGTTDGNNWFTVPAYPLTAGVPTGIPAVAALTSAAVGQWFVPNLGCSQIRARMSAFTSGAANVALDASGTATVTTSVGGTGVDNVQIGLADSVCVGNKSTAPTAGAVVATVTPGVAGTYEVFVSTGMSQGTPATGDAANMEFCVTGTVISVLAVPGQPGPAGPFGPFRVTITNADTLNVKAVASATASVVYAASIAARRVA